MHIKSMAIIRLEIFMQIKNLLNRITKKKKKKWKLKRRFDSLQLS